jgi:hypothetical protein
MKRREALSTVALLLGGTIIGADVFFSGCKTSVKKEDLFATGDIALLDEVGETILPTTASSPGAGEAKIGEFMKVIVTDCYNEKEQKTFTEGIQKLTETSKKKYGKDFLDLSAVQKYDLLVELDKEAAEYQQAGTGQNSRTGENPAHYFTMMKQLTLWGYFTSEPGATKALRYVPVPGRYEGCIPYKNGDKAWAL